MTLARNGLAGLLLWLGLGCSAAQAEITLEIADIDVQRHGRQWSADDFSRQELLLPTNRSIVQVDTTADGAWVAALDDRGRAWVVDEQGVSRPVAGGLTHLRWLPEAPTPTLMTGNARGQLGRWQLDRPDRIEIIATLPSEIQHFAVIHSVVAALDARSNVWLLDGLTGRKVGEFQTPSLGRTHAFLLDGAGARPWRVLIAGEPIRRGSERAYDTPGCGVALTLADQRIGRFITWHLDEGLWDSAEHQRGQIWPDLRGTVRRAAHDSPHVLYKSNLPQLQLAAAVPSAVRIQPGRGSDGFVLPVGPPLVSVTATFRTAFAAGGQSGRVFVWRDVHPDVANQTFAAGAISPEGEHVVLAEHGHITAFAVGTRTLEWQSVRSSATEDIKVSPDGQHVADVSRRGELSITELHTGNLRVSRTYRVAGRQRRRGHMTSVAWHPSSHRIAISTRLGVAVMSLDGSSMPFHFPGPEHIYHLAWAPGGKSLLVGAGSSVSSLPVDSDGPIRKVADYPGGYFHERNTIDGIAATPDGKHIAVRGIHSGTEVLTWPGLQVRRPSSGLKPILCRSSGNILFRDAQHLALADCKGFRLQHLDGKDARQLGARPKRSHVIDLVLGFRLLRSGRLRHLQAWEAGTPALTIAAVPGGWIWYDEHGFDCTDQACQRVRHTRQNSDGTTVSESGVDGPIANARRGWLGP